MIPGFELEREIVGAEVADVSDTHVYGEVTT